ncbi:MAG: DUF3108 domain-containing protein [Hyphomicrobiaceae bacterium]
MSRTRVYAYMMAVAAVLAPLPVGGAWRASAGDAPARLPAAVHALYKVEFGGFSVGTFEFTANIAAGTYRLSGDAKLSALAGLFQWEGVTRSVGHVGARDPSPSGYAFEYRSGSTGGSIRMGFKKSAVTSVTALPVKSEPAPAVALKPQHLKGVLDPLSAVMALTRLPAGGDAVNPCNRRLSIFDGKQRFDLVLSYRRQTAVPETTPSGHSALAFVCAVRYVPIAGHPDDSGTRYMQRNTGIEVTLRPIPSAGVAIPYRIAIPTVAGSAVLTTERVQLVMPGQQQIAFIH